MLPWNVFFWIFFSHFTETTCKKHARTHTQRKATFSDRKCGFPLLCTYIQYNFDLVHNLLHYIYFHQSLNDTLFCVILSLCYSSRHNWESNPHFLPRPPGATEGQKKGFLFTVDIYMRTHKHYAPKYKITRRRDNVPRGGKVYDDGILAAWQD